MVISSCIAMPYFIIFKPFSPNSHLQLQFSVEIPALPAVLDVISSNSVALVINLQHTLFGLPVYAIMDQYNAETEVQ